MKAGPTLVRGTLGKEYLLYRLERVGYERLLFRLQADTFAVEQQDEHDGGGDGSRNGASPSFAPRRRATQTACHGPPPETLSRYSPHGLGRHPKPCSSDDPRSTRGRAPRLISAGKSC